LARIEGHGDGKELTNQGRVESWAHKGRCREWKKDILQAQETKEKDSHGEHMERLLIYHYPCAAVRGSSEQCVCGSVEF
jgi:hypothetical protein